MGWGRKLFLLSQKASSIDDYDTTIIINSYNMIPIFIIINIHIILWILMIITFINK